MRKKVYNLQTNKLTKSIKLAFLSDLHENPIDKIVAIVAEEKPDYILLGGDILTDLTRFEEAVNNEGKKLLAEMGKLGKVYYSGGNHELRFDLNQEAVNNPDCMTLYESQAALNFFKDNNIHYLRNQFLEVENGIYIGGVKSYFANRDRIFDYDFAKEFARIKGYKILLSHHPELYDTVYKNLDVDLVLCGHAHGGQWRFFGRGVFAPQQGVFPKYTSGVVGKKMVVSKGMGNQVKVPRIFNPKEVVIININAK